MGSNGQFHVHKIPRHAHPLVRFLYERMNEERCSILELARRSGINRGTIYQWKRKNIPVLTHIEACLNVFDVHIVLEEEHDEPKAGRSGQRRVVFRYGLHGQGDTHGESGHGASDSKPHHAGGVDQGGKRQ